MKIQFAPRTDTNLCKNCGKSLQKHTTRPGNGQRLSKDGCVFIPRLPKQ